MKKIVSVLLSICIILSMCVVSIISSGAKSTIDNRLDEFKKMSLGDNYEDYSPPVFYEELYEYYSESNNTDTPDWIFGKGYTEMEASYSKGVFGEYLIYGDYYYPYLLGFFVYDPNENVFYDIQQAWEMKFENLSYAFEEYIRNNHKYDVELRCIYRIGDSDADCELTILDATYIQRALAQLEEFSALDTYIGAFQHYGKKLNYISDYDFDGTITVMDATAIQMNLAKVEAE